MGGSGAGTWVLLTIVLLGALGLLGLAALHQSSGALHQPGGSRPDRARLRAEADELASHAESARAEAERAVAFAVESRERAGVAERDRDSAWQAQEAAEQTYDRAWQAALVGRVPEKLDEAGLDRERVVSRAALSAYRRGDISVYQFREVWRRVGEPDPVQRERAAIAERYRVELEAARRAYDRAAAGYRQHDEVARIAEMAARALVDEAAESAAEAEQARVAVSRYPRQSP